MATNTPETTGAMIAGILFIPVMTVIAALYNVWDGWVLAVLWRWFAVPIFHLPNITVSVGIGMSLIFGLLTHQYQVDPKEAAKGQQWMRYLSPFLKGVVALIIGWIVKP